MPHRPQCKRLVFMFTHTPSHTVSPARHAPTPAQVPMTQICPPAQALPIVPQFVGLELRSVQLPEGVRVRPVRQTHIPPAQASESRH